MKRRRATAREPITDKAELDSRPRAERRELAGATGLEPATSCVTGRRSNQLNYAPAVLALPSIPSYSVKLRFVPPNIRNCRDSTLLFGN
jgi:hypothetical protein